MGKQQLTRLLFKGALDEALWGWLIRGAVVGIVASVAGFLSDLPLVVVALVAFWAFIGVVFLFATLKWAFRAIPRQALGIEFHAQRPSAFWYQQQVEGARDVWGAFLVGGSIRNLRMLEVTRFKRMILLDPKNPAVEVIPKLQASYDSDEIRETIRTLTKEATDAGCEVRWCSDLTFSLLTIGNPPPDRVMSPPEDMWIQCDVWLPGLNALQRPSLKVERRYNPALADALLTSFLALWEHSRPPDED